MAASSSGTSAPTSPSGSGFWRTCVSPISKAFLPLLRHVLAQALALDVLEHQKRAALVFAGVVDLHDVGVAELGDVERLGLEALQEDRIVRQVLAQHLDGDFAFQGDLFGEEDLPHA